MNDMTPLIKRRRVDGSGLPQKAPHKSRGGKTNHDYEVVNLDYFNRLETSRKDLTSALIDILPVLAQFEKVYAEVCMGSVENLRQPDDKLDAGAADTAAEVGDWNDEKETPKSKTVKAKKLKKGTKKSKVAMKDGPLAKEMKEIGAYCRQLLRLQSKLLTGSQPLDANRRYGKLKNALMVRMEPLRIRDSVLSDSSGRLHHIVVGESHPSVLQAFGLAKEVCRNLQATRHGVAKNNDGLVHAIAFAYQDRGLDIKDLIQIGRAGLSRAIDRFDHRRNVAFASYAQWWIRQALSKAVADLGRTIRVPSNLLEDHKQYMRSKSRFKMINRREPTPEEMSRLSGFSLGRIKKIENMPDTLNILDEPLRGGEDRAGDGKDPGETHISTLEDKGAVDPLEQTHDRQKQDAVEVALASLPPREGFILRKRFFEDLNREEIADALAKEEKAKKPVTRERIRQLEGAAFDRLKKNPQLLLRLRAFLEP